MTLHRFPAELVRCTTQGAWFRGQKFTIPGVSRRETASTRVLVTREFAGTRTPNTLEFESTTRTRDERVGTREYPVFSKKDTPLISWLRLRVNVCAALGPVKTGLKPLQHRWGWLLTKAYLVR